MGKRDYYYEPYLLFMYPNCCDIISIWKTKDDQLSDDFALGIDRQIIPSHFNDS